MSKPVQTPDMLLFSVERLVLDVTEPLDQLAALQILNLVKGLVGVAYQMGHSDGGGGSQGGSSCPACPYNAAGPA